MKMLTIYTDGGARGNPGPAAIGFIIYDGHSRVLKSFGMFIGVSTNNQAEYKALIKALEAAWDLRANQVKCYLDSELVVKQLQGIYKVKETYLKPLAAKALALTAKFNQVDFAHIPREKNKQADQLVNKALDEAGY